MRVLLDECLPRKLAAGLSGHDVRTVPEVGWSGVENGELLRLASQAFDALVTIDQRFAEGQRVPDTLVLVTLAAPSNRLEELRSLLPPILAALAGGRGGQRVRVGPKP